MPYTYKLAQRKQTRITIRSFRIKRRDWAMACRIFCHYYQRMVVTKVLDDHDRIRPPATYTLVDMDDIILLAEQPQRPFRHT